MPGFEWNIPTVPPDDIVVRLGVDDYLLAAVLWQRGWRDPVAVQHLLRPSYTDHLSDPFAFRHMHEAVDRVIRAITNHERIVVHGDYDADGVTTAVLLTDSLRRLGGQVDWYVPDRFTEGYGLNLATIEKLASEGTKLLMTVDCGTSNTTEIARARDLGIDVIVLDHHQPPPERPNAIMINPVVPDETYPFRGFSSAGVAFTFLRALLLTSKNGSALGHVKPVGWEKWFLDLVAISTVADLMPLHGENRVLVRHGLAVLRQTQRPGLRALLARIGATGSAITEQTIGFHIAPRINAAGRLRHASTAVKLLLTADPIEAQGLVDELEQINSDRQRLTSAATDEALEAVRDLADDPGHALFAPHWSPGVVGLVAGRIAEKVWKPVIVMTELEGEIVGSARSIIGVNIMTIMAQGKQYFARYGGHAGASGFTLKTGQREAFQAWFVEALRNTDLPKALRPLTIDADVRLPQINASAVTALDRLAPYGPEHPRPVILCRGLRCIDKSLVGADGQHLRIRVEQDGQRMTIIGFRHGVNEILVTPGERFDAVVEPSWNTWNGRTDIQLRMIDLRSEI